MISLNIKLPGGVDYPVAISRDDILAAFLQDKGKLIDFIKDAILELKKCDNDVVKIKLEEILCQRKKM